MHLVVRMLRHPTLIVFIAVATTWFAGCKTEETVTISARFASAIDDAKADGVGEKTSTLLGAGIASVEQLQTLSYNVMRVRLCRSATQKFYTHEQVLDADRGVIVKVVYPYLELDGDSCVDLGLGTGTDSPQNPCEGIGQGWVNLVDSVEVAEKLAGTRGIPTGTYRYVSVERRPRVGVQASVTVKDESGREVTLHSKSCGSATCESGCDWLTAKPDKGDSSWDLTVCRGAIPEPFQGTALGETHPTTGDVWSETPFDTFDETQGFIGEHQRYWRRCAHDMSQGPAELVYSELPAAENHIFELLVPLVVSADDTSSRTTVSGEALEVLMMYNLESVVTGTVDSMHYDLEGTAALRHGAYYGISDGFYSIGVSPLPLTPVARQAGEEVVRHSYRARVRAATGRPACFKDGPDASPSFSGAGFETADTCHPCHGLDFGCTEGSSTVAANDRVFSMHDMKPSVDFDLRIDLFRVVDPQTGELVDPYDIRALQVTPFFDGSSLPSAQIPFSPLAVRAIEKNSDGTVNLLEDRGGIASAGQPATGLFARIRNLPVTLEPGAEGKLIVELNWEPIYVAEPECQQCGWTCDTAICGSTQAYYEVPVVLEAMNVIARASR